MNRLSWARAALVGAASVVGLVGHAFGESGVTTGAIVIGQSITLQGGKNAYGVAVREGAKVMIDAVNAAGGVNGRQIVVRVLDDDNKPAVAEANARKLIDEGAFMLFGSVEGAPSTAVMKVAAELKVPLFGPMAGPPTLRRPHQPYVFPVRAEHRDEFRALMQYAKSIGMSSVGLFHADSDGGRQHLQNLTLIAQELGMSVAVAVPFKADAADAQIDGFVQQIAAGRPQFMINHGAAALYAKLIRKARVAGAKTVFYGVNSGSYQIAKELGALAQGMVFAQVVPSPWERKTALTREYQDAMRRALPNAEFSYGSLEGYMTAKALVQALRTAGAQPTRAGVIKALENSRFDLGGVELRYADGNHEGSHFVDLSLVARDGRFLH
jgi:branched-chain amino acid transport system substrate-binding protein